VATAVVRVDNPDTLRAPDETPVVAINTAVVIFVARELDNVEDGIIALAIVPDCVTFNVFKVSKLDRAKLAADKLVTIKLLAVPLLNANVDILWLVDTALTIFPKEAKIAPLTPTLGKIKEPEVILSATSVLKITIL
jgi:hypothetical protein